MSEIDTPAEYEPDNDMDLGWWPIETAPKDGTDILGYRALHGVAQTYFSQEHRGWAFWVLADVGYPTLWKPTHWRQLPEPPEEP